MRDSELALAFDFWRRLAEFGCVIVIIGIVAEMGEILFKAGEIDCFRKWWEYRLNPKLLKPSKHMELGVEVVALVFVVGGLALEFGASHVAYGISDRQTKSLQSETARAEFLASSNAVIVAQLTATNLISEIELAKLQTALQPGFLRDQFGVSDRLKKFAGTRAVMFCDTDEGCRDVGQQIFETLQRAGWRIDFVPTSVLEPGVSIGAICGTGGELFGPAQTNLDAGEALISELNNSDIQSFENFLFDSKALFSGVVIQIGPKPSPDEAELIELDKQWGTLRESIPRTATRQERFQQYMKLSVKEREVMTRLYGSNHVFFFGRIVPAYLYPKQ